MGGGKAEGQLCLRPVGTLMVRERMRKAPVVQSGRALPMGRCTSPPGSGGLRVSDTNMLVSATQEDPT